MLKWTVWLAIAAWFLFGSPSKDVANWFWSEDAAPWESVDAFYYPDRNDLERDVRQFGLEDVGACRRWVYAQASAHEDPGITRGDYECGVGYLESLGYGLRVYRATVR
jgi:hypothetical protein